MNAALSKGSRIRATSQNDRIFHQSKCGARGIIFAKEKITSLNIDRSVFV